MVTAFEPSMIDTGRFLLEFENLECEVIDVLKELADDELIALAHSCDLPQCIYDALATFDCLEDLDMFAENTEDAKDTEDTQPTQSGDIED